ncbi:hypothetical protein EV659_11611 [Rhodothalassium salexigens DSM 2132]|uniref:IraD/Gp25-like domain-containing protein n=1 Tax=Rhodothalassium salexigens DSM 2132 TaxID=1188247 RepID=A0A4V2SN70_RHOSA|nr:GPW/gp25 family protein [Rhodothalassium salexigens]MBB4212762.1 hypothetical protein [Rhodothalassium salexigens DSM 2132]MBK1638965.1 hypothetical protein [Rhodothalassium salexigens DSM 2132]TCP30046.1 hypothetical protein EV659_11611 [Rhodothalassium salexigens DSM 2132]
MTGMDRETGRALGGVAHVRQSIVDILTTRPGERVMRGDYGSGLPALVDRPDDPGLRAEIVAETAHALRTLEDRVALRRVRVARVAPGRIEIGLDLTYLPDGRALSLDGIVIR